MALLQESAGFRRFCKYFGNQRQVLSDADGAIRSEATIVTDSKRAKVFIDAFDSQYVPNMPDPDIADNTAKIEVDKKFSYLSIILSSINRARFSQYYL